MTIAVVCSGTRTSPEHPVTLVQPLSCYSLLNSSFILNPIFYFIHSLAQADPARQLASLSPHYHSHARAARPEPVERPALSDSVCSTDKATELGLIKVCG